jgi:hypothetical protein
VPRPVAVLALSPVCEHGHSHCGLADRLRSYNPHSNALWCRGPLGSRVPVVLPCPGSRGAVRVSTDTLEAVLGESTREL